MPVDAAHEGITQLLRAEAEASEVVKTAKDGAPPPLAERAPTTYPCAHPTPLAKFAAKAARLKDADKEAQEEIETFKMKREAHFATFKAEKSKDSGGHSGKVNKETDAELVAIKAQVLRGLLAPRLASPRVPLTPPPALRQVSTNKDAVIKMLLQSVTTVDVSK